MNANELRDFYLKHGVLPIGGGEEDEDKDEGNKEETVSKADFDAAVAKSSDLQEKLEDVRLEVMSPEYLEFLNSKEKGEDEGEDKSESVSDDDIENLSKKDLLALAEKRVTEKFTKQIEDIKASSSNSEESRKQREVESFSRGHEDYEIYRPIMYGLSLDPKNKSLGLGELYAAAKEHVKAIHAGASDEEKKRGEKVKGEKPGGDSGSYDRLRKLSADEAAKEAISETKEKLGHGIPEA